MTAAATLDELLDPLRADPAHAAVLLDVDGTLAPIVRHADDATVPEATRTLLIAVAKRFGVVACVTGRRAADARRIVSIGSISYLGNHGSEVLRAGAVRPEVDREMQEWVRRVQAFAGEALDESLARKRVRLEDKGAIVAFHWRGAPDEGTAEQAVRDVAARAEAAGLHTHWGRKVLEVRPPVSFDKGKGIRALLSGTDVSAALYAGDDATDLDAFRALTGLAAAGELETVVRVGVHSDEGPPEVDDEADVTVEGPGGVRHLLDALLRD